MYDRRGEEYLATLSEADSAALMTFADYHCTAITLPSKCVGAGALSAAQSSRPALATCTGRLLWRLTGEQRTDITLASRTRVWTCAKANGQRKRRRCYTFLFSICAIGAARRTRRMGQRVLCKTLGFSQPVSVTLAGHDLWWVRGRCR